MAALRGRTSFVTFVSSHDMHCPLLSHIMLDDHACFASALCAAVELLVACFAVHYLQLLCMDTAVKHQNGEASSQGRVLCVAKQLCSTHF